MYGVILGCYFAHSLCFVVIYVHGVASGGRTLRNPEINRY